MTRSRWAFVAGVTIAATAVASGQQTRFRVRADTVRVDVAVTRRGTALKGLQAADFELTDNGVQQTIDFASFEELPINAILALDMSDSVAGDRLHDLQQAGVSLLDQLRPGDQSALLTFSEAVVQRASLSKDRAIVQRELKSVVGRGETSLYDGAYAGLVLGEGDPGRSLVLIFSDGVDSSSWLDADAVLDAARRGSGVVYAISDSGRHKTSFLRDLTQATGGSLMEITTTRDLDGAFVKILAEFRERYVIGYRPHGVAGAGWHKLEVHVKGAAGRGAAIKARPGYQTGTPQA